MFANPSQLFAIIRGVSGFLTGVLGHRLSGNVFHQRIMRECVFFHNAPTNQMFLDNTLQNLRRTGMIPYTLGIDYGNWTVFADTQAVRPGAIDSALDCRAIELFEALLKIIPRLNARFARGTFGIIGIGANQNMPPTGVYAVFLGTFVQIPAYFIVWFHR